MRWFALFVTMICGIACGGSLRPSPNASWNFGPLTIPVTRDKIDLLFMIDNSSSMADKQELLARSLPALFDPLLSNEDTPDIHVGIVSSSLGAGGASDLCQPPPQILGEGPPDPCSRIRFNDDHGHLINRRPVQPCVSPPPSGIGEIADASPANFLAWLPDVPRNEGKPTPPVTRLSDRDRLIDDFGQIVRGAAELGCGLEAQMESWYRFLVQPDPYDSIQLDTGRQPAEAVLVGVDALVLQQRRDFLRADSVLAVIVVTDEEDSWSDPMWNGGRGWITRAQNNTFSTTGQLPRGTRACRAPIDPNNASATGPNDRACVWCGYPGTDADPDCHVNRGIYGPKEDGLNVRYTNDMKRRYGMNPQFPVQRYVDGLSSAYVPDRHGEHVKVDGTISAEYLGRNTCRNPIFARDLPTDPHEDLCHLTPGPRTNDQVVFAVIAGVPWQLLPDSGLTQDAWAKILGRDVDHLDDTGIDPHMIESIEPRTGIACVPGSSNDCDAIHGREWETRSSKVGIDLQYACTFPLPRAKDCTKVPESAICDCGGSYSGPLCEPNPADSNNPTLQTRGKAYPSIRELRVARALNGVVGSICPRSIDPNDPAYGYRSTLHAIADRILLASKGTCDVARLQRADGTLACVALVEMPGGHADQPQACGPRGSIDANGQQQPDPPLLEAYDRYRLDAWKRIGVALTENDLPPVCELVQRARGCEGSNVPGFCFDERASCQVRFGSPPVGKVDVLCGVRFP